MQSAKQENTTEENSTKDIQSISDINSSFETEVTDEFGSSNNNVYLKNKPLMLIGPSGVGKDTMIKMFLEKHPNSIIKCVSNTTRQKRKDEKEGVNYHYISKDEFEKLEKKNELIGIFRNYGNCYGLSKEVLKNTLTCDKLVYLDFNITTAEEIYKKGDLDINYIALLPPSIEELERRLKERGEKKIKERIDFASEEIKKINDSEFLNEIIKNDDKEKAFSEFEMCIKKLYPNLFKKIN